jgi:tetratricopeptide (TPR) repeat protein
MSIATAECCCAYNMMKLTRHLYGWTGDPRYFDYYEKLMLNHRLGTIEPKTGHTQYYLSLTLVQLRGDDLAGAQQTLQKGLARIPSSGKILWGLGVVSVLQGDTAQAAQQLERAVELLPEWAGSYSTLGVFYYETGQVDKAREVLNRFKGSNAGGLDVSRIEDALSHAPNNSPPPGGTISIEARQQLLQFALSVADRTL